MPPDRSPLRIGFEDLFDAVGTHRLAYGPGAAALSGRIVTIEGFLAHAHGPDAATMLVDQPGTCPDCAPVPAAAITLFGVRTLPQSGEHPVCAIGRLDYGFRIDSGVASFLRLEDAEVVPLEGGA